jgi:hypothetical protein
LLQLGWGTGVGGGGVEEEPEPQESTRIVPATMPAQQKQKRFAECAPMFPLRKNELLTTEALRHREKHVKCLRFQIARAEGTLDCGGSTPPWSPSLP